MIINDLCENWKAEWCHRALADFLNDLPEHGRSRAPKRIKEAGMYEQIDWLVHQCEPPYTLKQIDAYFIDCMQP